MTPDRRRFLFRSALVGCAAMLPAWAVRAAADLEPMTGGVAPIAVAERRARIAKAQGLMKAEGLGALVVEAGSSMTYFTGVKWRRSERLTAAVIPVEGEVLIVTPFFEEPSIRETLAVPGEVRVWQEDENPEALIAGWLKERKLAARPIGIEETVRYFAVDGLQKALPDVAVRNGSAVVRGCRMIKSAAEIALMQRANDIQIAAFRATAPKIAKGMSQGDIQAVLTAAGDALGVEGEGGLVLIGESSAYPHGSKTPRRVADGEIILFDSGVEYEGYQSDISRTMVFGTATAAQRKVFDQVRQGQETALAAARIGATAGSVDDAVRALYAKMGYGPGYKLPGTPHRTGHGIGMDGHEPVNLVHGEATRLAAGMCFSNEPGIYIPGSFGVRLEDCFHMTTEGPKWFSVPPTSLDAPFG